MEQIKKKLSTLKEEKEAAIEKAEEATQQKKEAEARADSVSLSLCLSHTHTHTQTLAHTLRIHPYEDGD